MAKSEPWCAVCCTQHTPGRNCPGSLLATGPERHARKFAVTHGQRLEYYGVLIAEAGSLWRARVFTYPNMLWSVPGGRGTIKFAGTRPGEAEEKAVAFLRDHCTDRRYTFQDADDAKLPGRVKREEAAELSPRRSQEERHPCRVPIRFGEKSPSSRGTTADLSAGGLCIATDQPLAKGSAIRMMLEVQAYSIPLTGTVAWVRKSERPGKPMAMGVQVHRPPTLYLRYVEEVEQQMEKQVAEPAAVGTP